MERALTNRAARRTSLAAILAAGLVLCFLLLRFPPGEYSFYPPCPLYTWTGFLCPGCGGTRAIAALLHGHWAEAWHLNPLVVSAIPAGLAYAIWKPKIPTSLWIALSMGVCLFGMLRNV